MFVFRGVYNFPMGKKIPGALCHVGSTKFEVWQENEVSWRSEVVAGWSLGKLGKLAGWLNGGGRCVGFDAIF